MVWPEADPSIGTTDYYYTVATTVETRAEKVAYDESVVMRELTAVI